MRPSFELPEHVFKRYKPVLLPAIALVACILQNLKTPVRHSLFVNAIAWLGICLVCVSRVGMRDAAGLTQKRKYSLLSGLLYAIALGCERAAVDKAGLLAPQVCFPWKQLGQRADTNCTGTPATGLVRRSSRRPRLSSVVSRARNTRESESRWH